MARDTNLTVTVGRFTQHLEKKVTPTGKSVTSFSLAVNGMNEDVSFIDFVAWGKTADVICEYCKKGDRILVEGHLQKRNYEDSNGRKVYITEVIADRIQFLQSRSNNENTPTTNQNNYSNNYYSQNQNQQESGDSWGGTLDIEADDLPF